MADQEHPASGRYVVVARRYRPRGFQQLVGQDHVATALTNAIETNRVGHAYLFTGARGVGKTSTARIFAKALNAPEGPTVTPDDSSDICQAIDAGEDIDVLEIDGASNRGIDEIRQLRSGVGIRPSRARYKIYIIDEVHMLTTQAFNALLKTLEEPPEHVKFIFCTTDPEKLPITVLSRCQRFDFAPVRVEAIAQRLREIVDAERAEADDDALRLLARRAAGSMRDSQSLLEQVLSFSTGRLTVATVHAMLGTADDSRLGELAAALGNRDSRAALMQIDAAILAGVDAGQLAEQLLGFFRDMLTATVGCDAEMMRFCGPAMHEELRVQGEQMGLQTLLGIVALVDQTLVRIRQSVHGQILLEAAVVQICTLPDLEGVAQLAKALAGGGAAAGGAAAGGAAAGGAAAGGAAAEKKNVERPLVRRFDPPAVQPAEPVGLASQVAAAASGAATASAAVALSAAAGPVALAAPQAPLVPPAPASSATGPAPAVPVESWGMPPAAATGATSGGSDDSPVVSQEMPPAAASLAVPLTAAWDASTANQVWKAALAAMDDLTADFARQAETVQPIGSDRLRLVFSADKELAKRSCEKPERKSKLEEVIRTVSARDVLLEFEQGVDEVVEKPPRQSAAINRRQRMRDAEQHPAIREVIEMFEAEIVRIDEPRQ